MTEKLSELADLFKLFGDETRLKLLTLMEEGEKSVGQLSQEAGLSLSCVSHQLRTLKDGKLIGSRREGKNVLYSLADDHVRTIIRMGEEHVEED